jgi:TRAP-type C4-dicarboxylate transport system substrate-binding protein
MNKTVVTALACLLLLVFLSDRGYAEPQRWKIGHVRPSGSAVDKDIRVLADRIKTETDGTILLDIYPANRLGDYSVVQERVSFGEVEMFVGPFATAIDKRVELAFTPFLVSTWQEAKEVYSHDSILFRKMGAFLEAQKIKIIAGWPVYFGGIALTAKPARPGDPDISKDMIIRVPPIRSFELTAKELGYTPYPITWAYAKMGLKTGMVEGIMGGGAEGYLGLKGVIRYYLPVKDHFEYWFVYMNLNLWNGLSEQNRTIIADACQEMEKSRYAVAEADEIASIEKLKDSGVEVVEFNDAERSAMRAKVRKNVWPLMKQQIGEDFDEIVAPR